MNSTPPTVLPGMKLRLTDMDGVVALFHVRSNSSRIIARWKNGMLDIGVPPGTGTIKAVEAIVRMKDRLMRSKPAVRFEVGQLLEFGGLTVRISSQSLKPLTVTMTGDHDRPIISIGDRLSCDDDEVTAIVSRLMTIAADKVAPSVLLPMARAEAHRLALNPEGWSISRGRRILGRCSGRGHIALSSACMFLPDDLRHYIICHELAHLTEMNHSPRFHRLCDTYLDGHEKELIKKLNNFKWPLL